MGVKPTTKIKFGAIYSKQELTDANIDPTYYENNNFTVSISRIDDTHKYVLWASNSFVDITNGYDYQQPIRPILKLCELPTAQGCGLPEIYSGTLSTSSKITAGKPVGFIFSPCS